MSQPLKTLEAIKYKSGSLQILNQLELPHKTVFEDVKTIDDGHDAIKTMKTRGAPAIAIVAALSLAVHVKAKAGQWTSPGDAKVFLIESLEYLKTSRPTAVNLFDAAAKLKHVVENAAAQAQHSDEVVEAYVSAAEAMLEQDVKDNMAIGHFGAAFIRNNVPMTNDIQVLTHCNTGSLATAGWGTALGIIRQLHKENVLTHTYCTETRPYNQGSRLTAYELVYEEIPSTLVCDSMVSALLRKNNKVQAIIVGADRVARNGDTANKIGTYQLAIAARHHDILFIVAAPSTSVDLDTACGDDIIIEERPAKELLYTTGSQDINGTPTPTTVRTAAPGIGVWNPSFDVTPSSLISAIVTEKGVVVKDNETGFDMAAFLSQ